MNLNAKARSLARYLSRIEERLLNLNPSDVGKRYQLLSIAMNKCTHFEGKLGTTGVSLLNIMEKNQIRTGEELRSYLRNELPDDAKDKNEINDVTKNAAWELAKIKDPEQIYRETASGNVKLATNHDIRAGFDRLIKACYLAATKSSIK